jgi:hypothetical protein
MRALVLVTATFASILFSNGAAALDRKLGSCRC